MGASLGYYGLALVAVVAAFLVRMPLSAHMGENTPYITFYPAVMIAAIIGGFGPGLCATLLSAIAAYRLILWPIQTEEATALGLFLGTGAVVSLVAGLYRRAQRRAAAFEKELALQETMRESEERFRAFFDNAAVGAVQLDLSGRFALVNDRFCRITGYSREELLAMSPRDLTHPDERRDDWDRYLRFRDMESPVYEAEKRYVRKDGRVIWVQVTGSLIRDAAGRPVRTAGIVRDITGQKRAEEAIGEQARLLDLTSDSIIVRDLDDRITYWNRGAEVRYGFAREEATGQVVHTLVQTRFPRPREEIAKELLRDGHWEGELEQTTRGGEEIAVASRWALLRDTRGEPAAILESNNDITERRRKERELVAARRAAEAANRAKSEFLANMSHEIRTPMTSILGYADLLMEPDTSEEERLDFLKTLQRNGQTLLQLINDMLDLSKIEAGKIEMEHVQYCPIQVVEEVLALLRLRAEEKNLELAAEYQYPLPAAIHTDPSRLRQILVNLVGNAIKFTERGTVRVCLRLTPAPTARLQFAVQDTGIGISPKGLAALFQPFSQVDASLTRRHSGTGLGLAISQRLAALLGGRIDVLSQLGRGSTFTVSIDPGRLDSVPLVQAPAPLLCPAHDEPAPAGLRGRILVVEDASDSQRLTRRVLEKGGLTVSVAPGGQSALSMVATALAEDRPYDLILMDIQMPGMDGHTVTRSLRSQGCRQPIVALTACAMPDDREACLQAGCDDYLSKPVSGKALLATVARYLVR